MVNLFVGGFPLDIQEIELAKLFCRYGDVNTIKIVRNRATKVCKGYGFIEMKNDADAQMAIEALDGMEMGDRQLSVRIADVKPAKPAFKPRPYGSTGGSAPRYGNRPEGRPYNKPSYGNSDRGDRPNYGNSERPNRPDYRNNDRGDRPSYGNSERPSDRPNYRQGDRPNYNNSDRPNYRQNDRPDYRNNDRGERPNYGNSERSDRPDYRNTERSSDRPDYRQSDRPDFRSNDPERKKRPRRGDV